MELSNGSQHCLMPSPHGKGHNNYLCLLDTYSDISEPCTIACYSILHAI